MAMAAIKQPQEPVRDQATQTEIQATQTDTQATQPQETKATTEKPDLYDHILHLIEHLAPDERLHLINDLVKSVYPIVSEYTAQLDYEDDSEDEQIAREATEALEYARAHPETVMSLEDFEAELDRAEAAGELPD
jgi:dTDP-4-dehydrorhamnose reductase